MKTIKPLEESDLLIKGVSETIKNKTKEPKVGFLRLSLGTLGARFLWKLLTATEAIATSQGRGTIRAGECTVGAGQNS